MKEYVSFIDFTNMSDEEKYKLLNSKDYEIGRLKEENKDLKSSNIYLSKTCDKYKKEIERLTISLQAQEELTMIWYNKVKKIREYIKEWQSFPHTNGSTHKELKNLMEIIECAGSDKE